MLFNSYIFMFIFLPFVLIGYYSLNRFKNYNFGLSFLLIISFIFCAYAKLQFLILLVGSIIFNYIIYLIFVWLEKKIYKHKIIYKFMILSFSIIINLSLLFYFKYFNFFIDNFNMLFKFNIALRNIMLPLGISFITFQQIAFTVDAYRGEIPKYNILQYALFVSFFPHLSSGPIITHEQLMPQFKEESRKKINWNNFSSGLYMFGMGMGKKVLLADTLGQAVNWGYSNIPALNSSSALFVSIAYTFQIYFDFSGYSDMAIGLGKMLNLELPINFNSPYKSFTILEFWNKWHITLSRFLSKYLYIPLGGNRKGFMRTCINTLIVFFCSGLWHGANWTFVLWGLLHGLFIIFTRRFKDTINKIPRVLNYIITFSFINFSWILFRSDSLKTAKEMLKTILQNNWGALHRDICGFFQTGFLESSSIVIPYWTESIIVLLILFVIVFKAKNVEQQTINMKYGVLSGAFLVIVITLSILSFSGISTFIYSNF